jgi:hypothetical protein
MGPRAVGGRGRATGAVPANLLAFGVVGPQSTATSAAPPPQREREPATEAPAAKRGRAPRKAAKTAAAPKAKRAAKKTGTTRARAKKTAATVSEE